MADSFRNDAIVPIPASHNAAAASGTACKLADINCLLTNPLNGGTPAMLAAPITNATVSHGKTRLRPPRRFKSRSPVR